MKIAVVYASRSGNTRRAAELIGSAFEDRGHGVSVQSVDALDFKALAEADVVGSRHEPPSNPFSLTRL